ncbi:MAG: GlxA family transcriptional regulator [Hyphomicrobiales bacterium]
MTDNPATAPAEPARLACVLLPRFNMMAFTSLLEPARIANYLSPAGLYARALYSFDGPVVTASNNFDAHCQEPPQKLGRDDIVFLIGSWGAEHYDNLRLLSWLRLQSRLGVRLCAVEMAAYVFARAGLLSRKQATVQWSYLAGFQEQFPDVEAVEQLFTDNGQIMTCSGGTASIDLMLHIIQQQHGELLAGEISDQIMHHPVRPAHTPQRMTLGRGVEMLEPVVRAAIDIIEKNISEPLGVPDIAKRVEISQRQLERQFNKAVGCSVVQFGLLLRLQHARVLLISTKLSVREIATASGFNSLSHFAFAFRKCFGRRPSEYRQAWPEQETEPQWPGTLARFLDTLAVQAKE